MTSSSSPLSIDCLSPNKNSFFQKRQPSLPLWSHGGASSVIVTHLSLSLMASIVGLSFSVMGAAMGMALEVSALVVHWLVCVFARPRHKNCRQHVTRAVGAHFDGASSPLNHDDDTARQFSPLIALTHCTNFLQERKCLPQSMCDWVSCGELAIFGSFSSIGGAPRHTTINQPIGPLC